MKRYAALLIAVAAFSACDRADSPTQSPGQETDPKTQPAGQVLKEFQVSEETKVSFVENHGFVTMTLEGHMDEQEANQALTDKLLRAKTMEEAYRVMDPAGAVPEAILAFDKLPKAADQEVPSASALEAGEASAKPEAPAEAPLAKAANHANPAADAWWDWTADANWWKSSVVGYPCGWHQADWATNVTWADYWRQGWYGTGYLMAASHTYGANAYAYVWSNGAWVLTNSMWLQPRHYIVWYSGDTSQRYRRYRVVGDGGAYARIHLGIRWDTQAPSDLGVICQG